MSKVSNIISSYLVSVFEGQIEGVVSNILFNNKRRAKHLVISQNDEQFCSINTDAIYKLGEGAVIIKNSSKLQMLESNELELKSCFSPINSKIVDLDGNFLGTVKDIELDEKYYIKNFTTSLGQTIEIELVVNLTDSVIIVNLNKTKIKISSFKTKSKINLTTTSSEVVTTLKPDAILPNRAITNYNFLINRTVTKNILNFTGEVIIKEGQTVTSKVLDIARIYGKIRELTKFSI